MRRIIQMGLILCALPAVAGITDIRTVPIGALVGRGQPADPRVSPEGTTLGFEFLGSSGNTLEVYVLPLHERDGRSTEPEAVPAFGSSDPFQLRKSVRRPVSEGLGWGPSKRDKPRAAVAATRKAVARGAGQINFDIYLSEPGRRRFLTEHPDNDAHPAFSPDGDYLAFSSGRTGQGDLYLYHFFAAGTPLTRLTDEPAGPEIYPAWAPDGGRLAYTGHLGGQDHIYIVDDVGTLVGDLGEARRRSLRKQLTRDLTPGWRGSCLAPSFSPDGRWVAYYAREGTGSRADLYVMPVEGDGPRLLMKGGLPETRGGPRWLPDSKGLIAVVEDAARSNPLVQVPISGQGPKELDTGTELNADPWVVEREGFLELFWTAQGEAGATQKRWRRIYRARLTQEKDQ